MTMSGAKNAAVKPLGLTGVEVRMANERVEREGAKLDLEGWVIAREHHPVGKGVEREAMVIYNNGSRRQLLAMDVLMCWWTG